MNDEINADQLFGLTDEQYEEREERDELTEEEILEEDIQVITEKTVCAYWSLKGSERTNVTASTQNPYHASSKNYDACSCPENKAEAALPMCNYDIVTPEDTEIYCPFYKAETLLPVFETKRGKVCTSRKLTFDEMIMERSFQVVYADGSTEEVENAAAGLEKIKE